MSSGWLQPGKISLRHATNSLAALCAAIQSDHEGTREPPPIDWPAIERQTDQALASSAPLPFKVRFHLPALLARQSDPTQSQSLAQRTVAHFGADRVAPPALMASLLCWVPLDTPGLFDLWRESQPNWRQPRPNATPRPSDWVRRPATGDLPQQLAEQVRTTGLLPDDQPQPVRSLPMCPLSLSVWHHLIDHHPAFWQDRAPTELETWLSTPARPRSILVALTEQFLAHHATELAAFRQALATDPDLSHRCSVTIRHLGTVRNGQPDTRDLSEPTRRVIDAWNVEHHLERLFNAWGADSDRVAFWRHYKQRIVAVEWFEHRGWLAMCLGPIWLIAYRTDTEKVIAVSDERWRTETRKTLSSNRHKSAFQLRRYYERKPKNDPSLKLYKQALVIDEQKMAQSIETGTLR